MLIFGTSRSFDPCRNQTGNGSQGPELLTRTGRSLDDGIGSVSIVSRVRLTCQSHRPTSGRQVDWTRHPCTSTVADRRRKRRTNHRYV